jgi:hypothetical protein
MSDFTFTPGHLTTASANKINNTPVKTGNVIYSEKHGLQFVDYADKRHTYGSVLTGVYNGTAFVDFTTSTLDNSLEAIKSNGFVVDGQIIKVGNSIYEYRKIGNNNFIIKTDESNVDVKKSKAGFIVYLPEFVSGNLVDINFLLSVSNASNTTKVFLVKVVGNAVNLTLCQDLDGVFDSSTFGLTVTHKGNGLFVVSANTECSLKVISYSVSSSGSSKNEGLYVVASDL